MRPAATASVSRSAERHPFADTYFRRGAVWTGDTLHPQGAVAVVGNRIVDVGHDKMLGHWIGPETHVVELNGRFLMPGLTDGHAHLDREALKGLLPSLADCQSIAAIVEKIQFLAECTPAGQWIVTMPLGQPPEYAWSDGMFIEGRLPDRHDLDRASSIHPVLIRCAWGYWPGKTPMVSVANSAALALAGIDRHTQSPSPKLRIERDRHGEPTGRLFEDSLQALAEFTLFRRAPNFTADDRVRTLAESMRIYNAAGTTAVFEGHGVNSEVILAYQTVLHQRRQTVRARLTFSPGCSDATPADIVRWVQDQNRRLTRKWDASWLDISGFYTQLETEPYESRLRARCAPCTGWAGFNYDCGLPEPELERLLEGAASEGLRVCAIQSHMVDVFSKVAKSKPIDGLRWVVAHPATLSTEQIAAVRANGMAITLLTGTFIWRRGETLAQQLGEDRASTISPARALIDAGVPVVLASDNVPVPLWPSIWHAVERRGRDQGKVVAPDQCISRHEALQCVTTHGAWLCGDENQRGRIAPGMLADLIILRDSPLTMPATAIAEVTPEMTWVDGRMVYERPVNTESGRPSTSDRLTRLATLQGNPSNAM